MREAGFREHSGDWVARGAHCFAEARFEFGFFEPEAMRGHPGLWYVVVPTNDSCALYSYITSSVKGYHPLYTASNSKLESVTAANAKAVLFRLETGRRGRYLFRQLEGKLYLMFRAAFPMNYLGEVQDGFLDGPELQADRHGGLQQEFSRHVQVS
jgi:hypothetical protein